MTNNQLTILALTLTAATIGLMPGLAEAQQSTPVQAQPATGGLEEVVVTAQRRGEAVQTVPITIEAFTAKTLDAMSVTNTIQLSDFTPGLNMTRANVGAVPFLRGVGNFTATPGNEAAIATYIDDVYRPAAGGSNYAFNNVERIEVLNGPQGTLFGRNAAGGVINVITKEPTQDTKIDLSTGFATYNTTTENLYASGGITPNLAADLSVYWENQSEGWGKNLYSGRDVYLSRELSLRSKWVLTPSDADKLTAIAYYDRTRNDQGSASNLLPNTVSQGGYKGTFGGFYDVDTNYNPYGETINYGGSVKEEHDFGWSQFTSISAYGRASWKALITNDSSPSNIQDAQVGSGESTWTQELRLASPADSKIKMLGGLYAFIDDAFEDPFTQYGTSLGATRPNHVQYTWSHQKTQSYAAYGQATSEVYDDTNLTFGLRYTYDNRQEKGATYTYFGNVLASGKQDAKYPKLTFRFALDHKLDENTLVYISWNRGFKSGNYNANTPAGAPTAPETLDAYEAGLKTDLLNKQLRIDASAFFYQFHNLQVQQQLITGTLQTNAAAAEYKGIDLNISAVPTDRLTLSWVTELLYANYTSFPNAIFNYIAANGLGYVQHPASAQGNEIPYADHLTSSFTARYDIPTDLGNVGLFGGMSYHHGFHFDTQGLLQQPAYWLMDASATWTSLSEQWDVKVYGNNLLDKQYYAQKQVSPVGETYSPAAPLTAGFTVGYHFR